MAEELGGVQEALGARRHADLFLAALHRKGAARLAAALEALHAQPRDDLPVAPLEAVLQRLPATVVEDLLHLAVKLEPFGRLGDKADRRRPALDAVPLSMRKKRRTMRPSAGRPSLRFSYGPISTPALLA